MKAYKNRPASKGPGVSRISRRFHAGSIPQTSEHPGAGKTMHGLRASPSATAQAAWTQVACAGCFAECIRANSIESQLRTTELLLTEEMKKNEEETKKKEDAEMKLQEIKARMKACKNENMQLKANIMALQATLAKARDIDNALQKEPSCTSSLSPSSVPCSVPETPTQVVAVPASPQAYGCPARPTKLTATEFDSLLKAGKIIKLPAIDGASAVTKGGNKSNGGNKKVGGNLSKAVEPSDIIYVEMGDDGLCKYDISEHNKNKIEALNKWVMKIIPAERRSADGPKYELMTWSWFKLLEISSQEEFDSMVKAIIATDKKRPQNKTRKVMRAKVNQPGKKPKVMTKRDKDVNLAGQFLNELGIKYDKRKKCVFLLRFFDVERWNNNAVRLTLEGRTRRPIVQPWMWADKVVH